MTLFEECKLALSNYFYILTDSESKDITLRLNKYWNSALMKHIPIILEVSNIESLISSDNVYVIVDDLHIPIFETNMKLLCENIYDVLCLASSKIFFISEKQFIVSNFPHEYVSIYCLSD